AHEALERGEFRADRAGEVRVAGAEPRTVGPEGRGGEREDEGDEGDRRRTGRDEAPAPSGGAAGERQPGDGDGRNPGAEIGEGAPRWPVGLVAEPEEDREDEEREPRTNGEAKGRQDARALAVVQPAEGEKRERAEREEPERDPEDARHVHQRAGVEASQHRRKRRDLLGEPGGI